MPRQLQTKDDRNRNRVRGNSQGSVYALSSGKYRWAVTLGFDEAGKQIRHTGIAPNKTEATRALARAITDRERKVLTAPDKITLGEWLDRWLAGRKPRVAETTYDQYDIRLRVYVPDKLKKMRLQDITRAHIRDLDTALAHRKLSQSTRSKVLSHLRSAFEEAAEDKYLSSNPAYGLRVQATVAERSRHKRKALTNDELSRFLAAAADDPMYALFYTLFSLGLRRGEVLGLRWSDVSFDDGAIRIEQQVKLHKNKPVIGALKTTSSRRTLYASEDLLEVLRAREQEQRRDRAKCAEAWQETGLVFTTAIGTGLHPRNVNRSIKRLCDLGGIAPFSSHTGRHTNITHRLRNGEKLEVVASVAGHASPTITAEVYRHVLDDEKRTAVFSLRDQLQSATFSEGNQQTKR